MTSDSDFTAVRPITIDRTNLTINVPEYAPTLWQSDAGSYGGWAEGEIVFYDDNPVLQHEYATAYRALSAVTSTGQPDDEPTLWERAPEWDRWTSGASFDEDDTCLYAYLVDIGGTDRPYGRFDIFRSLIDSNSGNDPTEHPDKWVFVATVYWPWKPWIAYNVYGAADAYVAYDTRLFKSRSSTPTGNPPTRPDKWLDVGVTNIWAMVDDSSSTPIVYGEDIVFTVTVSGRASGIGLINLVAGSVNITVDDDDDNEVFNQDYTLLDTSEVTNWYEYYTYQPVYRTRLVETSLPLVLNPTITVTISATSGQRALGHLVIGRGYVLGRTELGADVGIENYTRFATDDFGNRTIVPRGYSDQGNYTVFLPRAKRDGVARILKELRATPSLYVASPLYDSTIHFGVPTWRLGFDFPEHSRLRISMDGY